MNRIRAFALAAVFAASAAAHAAEVALTDPWTRADPARPGVLAVYFTVENRGGVAMLVGAESDLGGVAAIRSDTDGRPGGASRTVDRMMIAPGAEIAFAPGEYAVVLTDLPRPPRDGDRFALRLLFADGAVAEIEVVVAGEGA